MMIHLHKKYVSMVVLVVMCLAFAYVGYFIGKHNCDKADVIVPISESSDLWKTVAHLDLSNCSDLELVYENPELDIAYYRYVGERTRLQSGTELYDCRGNRYTVVAFDVNGFTVEAKDNDDEVTYGYSGTALYDAEQNQVGAMSSRDSEYIYCIWL